MRGDLLVQHTKHGQNRKTYFLDSQKDFQSNLNLGVQISEELAGQLKAKKNVGEPHLYYADRTIRVAGKISLQEDRPYLRIEDVEDIRIVDPEKCRSEVGHHFHSRSLKLQGPVCIRIAYVPHSR